MSADDAVNPIQSTSIDAQELAKQQATQKQLMRGLEVRQEASKSDFTEWTQLAGFNPMAMSKKFETMEKHFAKPTATTEAEEEGEVADSDLVEELAKKYHKQNSELLTRTLLILKSRIQPDDTIEDIMRKLLETYPDHSLADDALDFLKEASSREKGLSTKLARAKEAFNNAYGREIRSGKNINAQAKEFSSKGLGSPTGLRDLYRDITGNPREALTLFDELIHAFNYSQMKNVIDFILHSLGADMKAKGPSISKAELQRMFTETRTMQAFLGLFRFFQKRMKLIDQMFDDEDLRRPNRVTFELLAKILMQLLRERYPSVDKVLRLAYSLGISEEVIAQIIVFSQYRDALRELSPKLFKSERHRQDLMAALLEALSDLEDTLEEEEEEEEKES